MLYLTMLSCCVVNSQRAVAMFFNIVSEIKRKRSFTFSECAPSPLLLELGWRGGGLNLLPDVQKGGGTEL